jgi:nucleotide-binding universal stress UspA family protein
MNTIVVATDFSPAADNAMLYASHLANKINASLLLLHVYQIPVTMGDVPVMLIPVEEMKQQVDNNLNKSKDLVAQRYPSVAIETESRMGDVTDELNDICNQRKPLFIVAGKHGQSGVEKVFFGNTTLSIINHSKAPVLAVPNTVPIKDIQNIALAVDLSAHPEEVLEKTRNLIQSLNAQLHVIHVKDYSGEASVEDLKHVLPDVNPIYRIIKADDFSDGIQQYATENGIDLLILFPHHHNLMEKLFFKTHTTELIEDTSIPILSIRE